MNNLIRLVALLAFCCALPVAAQEQPVEITVRGRQPGPPMWLVRNGEHELWIFARLSPIPKDMQWESAQVAAVIAQADEAIGAPDMDVDISPLTMLNPINMVRGVRLARRLGKNPDGGTLADNLPPELYARFSAIRAERFPRDKDLEKLRPLFAGGRMMRAVLEQEELVSPQDIDRQIERLLKRNKSLKRTEVEVKLDAKGGYRKLADRVTTFMESLPPELEQACFEWQMRRIERDLGAMKYRAESWASGYIDEFRGIPLPGDSEDPCLQISVAGSEREVVQQLIGGLSQRWLAEADRALQENHTTFAVLGIAELLDEAGPLAALAAKGYEIRVP